MMNTKRSAAIRLRIMLKRLGIDNAETLVCGQGHSSFDLARARQGDGVAIFIPEEFLGEVIEILSLASARRRSATTS